jgi:hypothetical protein
MSDQKKKYYLSEHIWRIGRWLLGLIVIIVWGAPTEVYFAFGALGLYEQLHGVICHWIDKLLKCDKRVEHSNWE